MTPRPPYELVLTPPVMRAVRSGLPEAVAAAAIEFLTGALLHNPRRVAKPLRGQLQGIHSARRATYRILYRINDSTTEVVAIRIDHRSETYRPPLSTPL